jgi:hypothetical protein
MVTKRDLYLQFYTYSAILREQSTVLFFALVVMVHCYIFPGRMFRSGTINIGDHSRQGQMVYVYAAVDDIHCKNMFHAEHGYNTKI